MSVRTSYYSASNHPAKLTIAYHPASNGGLSFRGTEEALFQYMHYAETLLGHKSILCLRQGAHNEPLVLAKFQVRFPVILTFSDTPDLERQLVERKVDAFYTIRSGRKEEPMLSKIPMLVHCVYDMSENYGIMAGVSETVAQKFNRLEFVPHIVSLADNDENLRGILGIPSQAIVFGRHGGADTWDLPMAKQAMLRALKERPNIYFLFAVRPHCLQDVSHVRIIYLNVFSDPKIRRKFLNTLDYFFHAQSMGETFGLSAGEASMANKPVIVWNGGLAQEHLRILGDRCIKYDSEDGLFKLLTSLDPEVTRRQDWRAYQDYNPAEVMGRFNQVFLARLPA